MKNRFLENVVVVGSGAMLLWSIQNAAKQNKQVHHKKVKKELRRDVSQWENEGGALITPVQPVRNIDL